MPRKQARKDDLEAEDDLALQPDPEADAAAQAAADAEANAAADAAFQEDVTAVALAIAKAHHGPNAVDPGGYMQFAISLVAGIDEMRNRPDRPERPPPRPEPPDPDVSTSEPLGEDDPVMAPA